MISIKKLKQVIKGIFIQKNSDLNQLCATKTRLTEMIIIESHKDHSLWHPFVDS